MKFLPICLFVAVGLLLSAEHGVVRAAPSESDGQVAAREVALELAGGSPTTAIKSATGIGAGS